MLTSKIPIENQILKVFPNFILSLNIFYFPFQLNLTFFLCSVTSNAPQSEHIPALHWGLFLYHSLTSHVSNLNIMAEG